MKLTTIIYKAILSTVDRIPLKFRMICFRVLKFSKFPNSKFYKDFRYIGIVKVPCDRREFRMISSGGTIENEIFWKGIDSTLEPETIWLFNYVVTILKIKSLCDVGANTGLYSLYSYCLNSEIKIVAFEPSAKTYEKMIQNFKLNGFEIRGEQLALSNRAGNSIFYDTTNENQTNASLSDRMIGIQENPSVLTYDVVTMKLDDYIEENNITDIHFLKVDVELHEPEFFEGARNSINKFKPFIIFEVLLPDIADSLNTFFIDFDYELFEFIKKQDSYYLSRVELLEGRPNGNWNYFAIPTDKIDLFQDVIYVE